MQYFATHFWQSAGQTVSSMTLQQVYHKKKKLPIAFACICTDAKNGKHRRQLVETLTDWFYEKGLSLCEYPEAKATREIRKSMEKCLKQALQEACDMQIAGVLCWGHSFLMFRKGSLGIHILNTRRQRTQCCVLHFEERNDTELLLQEGLMQPGIGILLMTKGFENQVETWQIEECLNVRELHTAEGVERRLRELAKAGEIMKPEDRGAVLLCTRE